MNLISIGRTYLTDVPYLGRVGPRYGLLSTTKTLYQRKREILFAVLLLPLPFIFPNMQAPSLPNSHLRQ